MLCGKIHLSCGQMQSNLDNSGIIEREKCDYFSWARIVLLGCTQLACAKRGFITQTFRCTPTINYFRYWLHIGPIRKVVVIITDRIPRPRVTSTIQAPRWIFHPRAKTYSYQWHISYSNSTDVSSREHQIYLHESIEQFLLTFIKSIEQLLMTFVNGFHNYIILEMEIQWETCVCDKLRKLKLHSEKWGSTRSTVIDCYRLLWL